MPKDDDTPLAPDGTQPDAASADEADAAKIDSDAGEESGSTLKSRYAGQTAKVNELTGKVSAAEGRAAAAEARLADYEAGRVGSDEALKAQLAVEQRKTAAAEAKASLALIEGKYPEVFAELGEAAAHLPDEKLASMEARFKGDAEAPTPRRPFEKVTGQPAAAKVETADEVEARLLKMPGPAWAQRE